MRRVFVAIAAGMALISCEARQPTANQSAATMPMGVESSGPIARSPLSPPGGYASPSFYNSPTPLVPPDDGPGSQPAESGWHASPRWGAVEGGGCIEVGPDASTVANCSQEDAAGLTLAPAGESSGY
jgi:hypothetical protein